MSDTHYWHQKDGSFINVMDMDEIHIKRCFKFLPKNSEWIDIFKKELLRREKEIKIKLNDKNSPVSISIGLSRMPENCGECPFYINSFYEDEDCGWGSGVIHYCPFNCDNWGCLVERPSDCPLKENQ